MTLGGRHDANIYKWLGDCSCWRGWGQMRLYCAPFINSTHYTLRDQESDDLSDMSDKKLSNSKSWGLVK
jgi:hypothetical protein